MDEGAGFIVDCFLPLLERFGFNGREEYFIDVFVVKDFLDKNFLYATHTMGFNRTYHLVYPVKLKHKFFSREPYLKLKRIGITDECKLSSIQLETYIAKGIKLISAYKKELELLKDF